MTLLSGGSRYYRRLSLSEFYVIDNEKNNTVTMTITIAIKISMIMIMITLRHRNNMNEELGGEDNVKEKLTRNVLPSVKGNRCSSINLVCSSLVMEAKSASRA